MRHKHLLMSVLIILMLVGLTLPAAAITFGKEDGNGHPYVGFAAFFDQDGNFLWPCSGTLLSPTVFLTAGHCTSLPAVSARVWFDSDLTDLSGPEAICEDYPEYRCRDGEPIPHDDYMPLWPDFPNTYDVGIVDLDVPIYMDTYGQLPELGLLDELATRRGQQDQIIRTVGYGYQMIKPIFQWVQVRFTSTSKVVNLRSNLTDGYNIHTSNNPGKGKGRGGSCFGDSGGPIIYPKDSDIVVGVVSFGLNDNCKGADFAYRTDIEEAQDFILPFLED